jgi:hypothetical protein
MNDRLGSNALVQNMARVAEHARQVQEQIYYVLEAKDMETA